MAETVSPKIANYIDRINGSLSKFKASAMEQKETAVEVVGAIGGAYGSAYLTERYPDRKIAGADPDAVIAVVLGAAAMFTGGIAARALGAIATGSSCSVAARWGAAKGQKDRAAANAAASK